MKTPGMNNMYAEAKACSLSSYDEVIEGSYDAAVCVVFAEPLSDAARAALEAACRSLGADVVFLDAARAANVLPASLGFGLMEKAAGEPSAVAAARAVFAAVEGLDPIAIIASDAPAAEALSRAYRAPLETNAFGNVFGRLYVAFASFEDDLADNRLKQRDWALLKKLKLGLPEA